MLALPLLPKLASRLSFVLCCHFAALAEARVEAACGHAGCGSERKRGEGNSESHQPRAWHIRRRTGATATFRLLLKANKNIPDPSSGLHLYDRMNNLVFAAGTRQLRMTFAPSTCATPIRSRGSRAARCARRASGAARNSAAIPISRGFIIDVLRSSALPCNRFGGGSCQPHGSIERVTGRPHQVRPGPRRDP